MSPNESRTAFRDYRIEENKTGCNCASSYIRAIDLLDSILSRKAAADWTRTQFAFGVRVPLGTAFTAERQSGGMNH
jgi:hypothetical protein